MATAASYIDAGDAALRCHLDAEHDRALFAEAAGLQRRRGAGLSNPAAKASGGTIGAGRADAGAAVNAGAAAGAGER
jgi:hypothetical protein